MIEAEVTPGNQWRVPVLEVERLKRDGLPPIPRPMPVESPPDFDESDDHGHVVDRRQSSAVAAAAEEVEVLRHQAEGLRCARKSRPRSIGSGRGLTRSTPNNGRAMKPSAMRLTRRNVNTSGLRGFSLGLNGR